MSIYINSFNNHVELSLQNNSKTSYFRNFLLDFFFGGNSIFKTRFTVQTFNKY